MNLAAQILRQSLKALVMSEPTQKLESDDSPTVPPRPFGPKDFGTNVDVFYGDKRALFGVDLDIGSRMATSLIGPSGCGKSTFLRCIKPRTCHRRLSGLRRISLDGEDIYGKT